MGVTLLICVGVHVTETGSDTGAVENTNITKISNNTSKYVHVAVMLVMTVGVTGTDRAAFTGAIDNTNITKISNHINKYLWVLHY